MGGRFEITIDGIKGDAKSMQYQARCEQTLTGVRWVFTDDLSGAVSASIQAEIETLRTGLTAGIRAAKMAIFIANRGETPNDSWQAGLTKDLAEAEAALSGSLGSYGKRVA